MSNDDLIRIAVTAAVAGIAAWLLVRRRATRRRARVMSRTTSPGYTVEEMTLAREA